MAQEIERKWIVGLSKAETIIRIFGAEGYPFWQGYLTKPGTEDVVRIRSEQNPDPRKPVEYFLDFKTGEGLVRNEFRANMDPGQFLELKRILIERGNGFLSKKRYKIPLSNYIIELDMYEGNLSPLCTAEIEFKTEKEAKEFDSRTIPWFGLEVTSDKWYGNMSLAWRGLPEAL